MFQKAFFVLSADIKQDVIRLWADCQNYIRGVSVALAEGIINETITLEITENAKLYKVAIINADFWADLLYSKYIFFSCIFHIKK